MRIQPNVRTGLGVAVTVLVLVLGAESFYASRLQHSPVYLAQK